jgi:transcriptional regulator with GAF, ATPase, and Fis domain
MSSGNIEDLDSDEELDARDRTERRPAASNMRRVVAVWPKGQRLLDVGERSQVVIGRGVECDLRIDDASVSRRHAILHLSPSVAIEDLGSTNGTTVATGPIPPHQRVPMPYDSPISIGSALVVLQTVSVVDWDEAKTETRLPSIDTKMSRVTKLIELLAKSTLSVLVVGETGVGKEVATDRLHALAKRPGPLVKINCAALPEQLLEAELFGYERGAFTGAATSKPGLVEAADGGTLFLDEIGELPAATQAKLLRVLEAREVQRLGALKARSVDVRFVAATNRNLEALVRSGRFRSDLFFRLNGMTVEIPPLRERLDELPQYVRQFIGEVCAKLGRPPATISEDALAMLKAHPWPGNLRELRNVIDRALVLAGDGPIERDHIVLGSEDVVASPEIYDETPPPPSRSVPLPSRQTIPDGMWTASAWQRSAPPPSSRSVSGDAGERERIMEALAAAGGNQTEAAKLLGVSRRTLVYKLGYLGIPRPRKKGDG